MTWLYPCVCTKGVLRVFSISCLVFFLLVFPSDSVPAKETIQSHAKGGIEFSARLTWRSRGKTSKAQLFVKGDRYRIEHLGGLKTDLGYAGVTIVRLDQQQVWYILSQRRLVMAVPLTTDFLLPFSVRLEGEISRTLIGDSFVDDRPADLYEVRVERAGQEESYFEWVDSEQNLLLKLVSQDRDWFVEYGHVVQSRQPEYFFETPLGYQIFEAIEQQVDKG